MNSRHLVLIVLTGVGLIVFAPMSGNKEPGPTAQLAEKQASTPAAVQKAKVVLPPGLGLDGNGTLQPAAKSKIRRVVIDTESGSLKK